MATLSDIESQLEALKKQRSSGVAKISYAGKSIEYRNLADIDKAIFKLEDEIKQAAGLKKSRTLKTYASKGL